MKKNKSKLSVIGNFLIYVNENSALFSGLSGVGYLLPASNIFKREKPLFGGEGSLCPYREGPTEKTVRMEYF